MIFLREFTLNSKSQSRITVYHPGPGPTTPPSPRPLRSPTQHPPQRGVPGGYAWLCPAELHVPKLCGDTCGLRPTLKARGRPPVVSTCQNGQGVVVPGRSVWGSPAVPDRCRDPSPWSTFENCACHETDRAFRQTSQHPDDPWWRSDTGLHDWWFWVVFLYGHIWGATMPYRAPGPYFLKVGGELVLASVFFFPHIDVMCVCCF